MLSTIFDVYSVNLRPEPKFVSCGVLNEPCEMHYKIFILHENVSFTDIFNISRVRKGQVKHLRQTIKYKRSA